MAEIAPRLVTLLSAAVVAVAGELRLKQEVPEAVPRELSTERVRRELQVRGLRVETGYPLPTQITVGAEAEGQVKKVLTLDKSQGKTVATVVPSLALFTLVVGAVQDTDLLEAVNLVLVVRVGAVMQVLTWDSLGRLIRVAVAERQEILVVLAATVAPALS